MAEPVALVACRRIVLVGFMGSGKTSVGRELAALTGFSFLDLDALVEERTGRTVAETFRVSGERGFRDEERAAARLAAARDDCVIAAGGGAFAEAETRAILRRGAVCVYLRCDLETILRRLPADNSRPLAGNRERMTALLSAREPSYQAADVSVDGSHGTPAELACEIVRALASPGLERDERR